MTSARFPLENIIRQRLEPQGTGKRVSSNGYKADLIYYEAKRCEGCPLRGVYHKSKNNRYIEVAHRPNDHKAKARKLLMRDKEIPNVF